MTARSRSLAVALALVAAGAAGSSAAPKGRTGRAAARRPAIIASVGTPSATPEVAEKMLRSGTRWFRFNLAHKNKRLAAREASVVRDAAARLGVRAPLLFDLPGGKIRTGPPPAAGQVTLREGAAFTLRHGGRASASTGGAAWVDYKGFDRYLKAGDRVLLHQGKIELEVTGVSPGEIATRVVRGGILRGRATVNVVGADPVFPTMTPTDRRKLAIAVASGADYIGVSMVQRPEQMRAVRRALDRLGAPQTKLVAKIETLSALDNLDAIVAESDMVMIARGDLATAVGSPEALRVAEKKIARVCKRRGVEFIDATGFEGPDAAAEVARAKKLGSHYILLKNTAIDPDPAGIVERLHALLE